METVADGLTGVCILRWRRQLMTCGPWQLNQRSAGGGNNLVDSSCRGDELYLTLLSVFVVVMATTISFGSGLMKASGDKKERLDLICDL